jgi:prepilin-type N-terminal cleavage/methylation domain-containing protein
MKRRQGFTLVELLVSMALIMFIMAILSQAFIAGLSTFRNLKAQGDLAEKLRGVTQILQRDLAADHFNGKKRLSDPDFWLNGPPSQGFLRIWQSAPATGTIPEGSDLDGIGSYISTNHYLAFTVKQRGNEMGDFLSASAPMAFLTATANFGPAESRYQLTSGGTYNYQWAEVAWFMQPQINPSTGVPDQTVLDPDTGSPPVPLYTLYRRQRLLVPDNNLVQPVESVSAVLPQQVLELSCWQNGTNWYFNSPIDITVPWRRFGMASVPTNPSMYPGGLLYLATTNPLAPVWVPPSATPPVPPTYVPLPNVPPVYPLPLYPTLSQQGAVGTLPGADTQLNDVISFDVRVLVINPATGLPEITNGSDPFVTALTTASIYNNANPAFCNPLNPGVNPSAPVVFDTWSSLNDGLSNYSQWNVFGQLTSIPMWNQISVPPRGPIIQAIQISIRIWDFKTNQTRQVTIVQAM